VGCGDGKISAEIADRLPRGSVLGVDPSTDMIAFAQEHFRRQNLDFAAGDATRLAYREEFDLAVSFNALHWVMDQAAALSCIRGALRRGSSSLCAAPGRGFRWRTSKSSTSAIATSLTP
jgi:trans-aconitate 2-methyltransferase